LGISTSGGTGFQSFQWQRSTDDVIWADILNENNSNFTPPSTSMGTMYYRVVVTPIGLGCTPVTSGSARVRIFNDPTVTVVANEETICTGTGTKLSATVSDGTGTITYQWQSSEDGVTFTNISGANSVIYNTPALASTTYYRLEITQSGSGCGTVTSSVTTVMVVPAPIAQAGADKNQCTNDFIMTATAPAVGTGTWTVTSGTANIENPNSPTTKVIVTSTTATLRWSIDVNSTCSNGDDVVLTVVASINITAQPTPVTECVGGTLPLVVTTEGGVGTFIYQWQSSTDNSTWSDIAGANAATYTPSSTTAGMTYYHVIIRSALGNCSEVTSNSTAVDIIAKPIVKVTATSTTVCNGAAGIQLNATVTGGVDCSIQWQNSSSGGAAWSDIPGEKGNTFSTSNLGQTTKYRVTLNCNGNGCCN
jgi:large repetitive protein